MKNGTRVQYKRDFLRSLGIYAGEMCFAKGSITEIKKYSDSLSIATITWDEYGEELPNKVNTKNLSILGKELS